MLLFRQALALHQGQEVADQVRHVLAALAQRRQAQRHDVEAEEQVFAEQALLDQRPQVLVGGGDDAHVALDRRAAANRRVFALLEHAQQPRLRLHRHVADLVEEQRAALGLLEAARCERLLAPVKAPFSWPNNSDSIRSRGIAAMLMATNWPLRRLP